MNSKLNILKKRRPVVINKNIIGMIPIRYNRRIEPLQLHGGREQANPNFWSKAFAAIK